MREDQHAISVTVDGRNLGIFDKKSGTEGDSSETKYSPGGMVPQIVLGGRQTISNETVSRLYVLERDHELARSLLPRRGKAAMSISDQPLDEDGNPFGAPVVTVGKLKRIKWPDSDSESDAAALFELEMSTSGTVG